MLIRAKGGWTQDLWNAITRLTEQGLRNPPNEEPPENFTGRMSYGVLLRAYVDGPFGSSIRARWGDHSTVLIVAGGSGVSFGLSILQYICLCLSGRDGRYLGGRPGGWGKKRLLTTRVRFIWLVREYSHIQWCASILRRCLSMLPSSAIQVDIFITNFQPTVKSPDIPTLRRPPPSLYPSGSFNTIDLAPPLPSFARGGTSPSHGRADSVESIESHDSSADSDVDLSYYTGEYMDDEIESADIGLAHRTNMLELTNFDGDDDTALPGEDVLNKKVKKEGKLRRAQSRRLDRMSVRLVPATKPDERSDLGTREPSGSRKPKRIQDRLSVVSSHSTDRLLPISPLSDRTSVISPIDSPSPLAVLNDHGAWRKGNALISPISTAESSRTLLTPTMSRGETLLTSSTSDDKTGFANRHGGISQLRDRNSDGLGRLKVNEQEVVDAGVVAEHARLGKPKLDRIIADEVEHSKGSVIVACCGPTSLNAMVRKIIAGQIDPGRIRRGDLRGSIVLVSEEFEY
ncbi:hypothetical protein SERLA73DRAFT_185371 [Serpula lacrymans var. lacrymans S7.3]|uniref:Ferric reductase NAD binding domain-containing protein n=2 Tax=Serpula lacrymans var. lacrymans TaxID=341189 RepID=F8Q5Q1_SERL3|nr:hypothetical protein SERLA73DRAFT_185371 [Serpula lacrymans var. lacrymans S7.3]